MVGKVIMYVGRQPSVFWEALQCKHISITWEVPQYKLEGTQCKLGGISVKVERHMNVSWEIPQCKVGGISV